MIDFLTNVSPWFYVCYVAIGTILTAWGVSGVQAWQRNDNPLMICLAVVVWPLAIFAWLVLLLADWMD